jgi:PBP1b-binding outer membrane lipoprotein LpoB
MINRIKIIILCCTIFIISCNKVLNTPVQLKPNSMNIISNGDLISFKLQTRGLYTLTMVDTIQNQVISREKFTGRVGVNTLNIYTKTLTQTYLSVVLTDSNNNQINKTKITIK